MSFRDQLALVKQETTPGTLESFTLVDVIPCESTTPSIQATAASRNILAPNLPGKRFADLMTERQTTVTLKTEVSGSGTPGVPSAVLSKMLLMAGFNQTISSSSVVHALPWPFHNTRYSFAFDADGQRYAGKGGLISSQTFSAEAGGYMAVESTLSGIYVPIQAITSPSTGTLPTLINPPLFNSQGVGSITIANTNVCVSSYRCTIANTVNYFEDGNCAPNFKVADRSVEVTISIQRPALATINLFEKALASELVSLNLVYGTVPGNITTFNHPSLQLSLPDLAERKGENDLTLTGMQVSSSFSDQFTITQT